MSPVSMTIPLWGLVIFILWTICVVGLLLTVRVRHLAAGGSPKAFGTPDDNNILWRLYRVQANLVENLPLYTGVVFFLTLRGKSGFIMNSLVVTYISARIVHSLIHIANLNPNFRLVSLIIQLSCLVVLVLLSIS